MVDQIFNDCKEYKHGNALVVDQIFNDCKEYKNGNALVVLHHLARVATSQGRRFCMVCGGREQIHQDGIDKI